MSDIAMIKAAAKLSEVGARVDGRLKQISDSTGISFPTLFASVVTAAEESGNESEPEELDEAVDKMLDKMASADSTQNIKSAAYDSKPYADMIDALCETYGIDPALIHAVITCESNYNPNSLSSAGAIGLMQLMPSTAEGLGVTEPYDPWQNLDGGIRYLLGKIQQYDGDVRMALAAYNMGSGALSKYGISQLYDEIELAKLPKSVQTYLSRIEACMSVMGEDDYLNQPHYV